MAFMEFLKFPTRSTFPAIGDNNRLYIDLRSKKIYYWDHGTYKIASPDITEQGSNPISEEFSYAGIVAISWADLKALRDEGELKAGQQYRITDYVTTTVQANTQSAGHAFDLIVTADDVDKLNEDARAIQHEGDTYFANSKLESWQLKYCLDNDTSRFAWASSSGKGVIYQMIDEFNNDCPYDFKNIQFTKASVWYYTFADDLVGSSHSNKIGVYISSNKATLNANTFGTNCYSNTFGDGCYSNTFGNDCSSNTFGNDCSSNTFGNSCSNNTFGNTCSSNTVGNGCNSNTFGDNCSSNTFGNSCYSNTFGNGCNYLKISENAGAKRYLNIDNGLQGASSANQLDLYDSAIAYKNYQISFKKDINGKVLMTWQDDKLIEGGKYKDNNLDNVWKNLSHDIDGGTW